MSLLLEFTFRFNFVNSYDDSLMPQFREECNTLLEANNFYNICDTTYGIDITIHQNPNDFYTLFKSLVHSVYSDTNKPYINNPNINLITYINQQYFKYSPDNLSLEEPSKIKYRLYCGYMNSTSESTSLQNEWENFHWPTTSVITFRDSGGHIGITGEAENKFYFIYNGNRPTWLNIEAVCNIYKGSGGNANRNIETVWYVDGVPTGPIRGSHMNNQECNILTGAGQIYITPGSVFSPMIRNVENDDKINLRSCTFNIVEDN